MSDRIITAERLTDITVNLFETCGVSRDHAEKATRIMVLTSLRGVDTHGIRLLPYNLRRLVGGGAKVNPDIRTVSAAGPIEIMDGDWGLGFLCGTVAMERAVEIAREQAIGWVTIRESNHYGASGTFCMLAVEQGMIGLSLTNTPPNMHIAGGISRSIGNNPMAIGAPGPDFPVVLDMAMSVVAGSKIGQASKAGKPIPPEWFLKSPDGKTVFRPFAGPKGSGLAIMIEILTAVLGGGAVLSQQGGAGFNKQVADGCSHTQIAIDLRKLIPADEYDDHMRFLVNELHEAETAPGVDEIRLPGERTWKAYQERIVSGIPISTDVIDAIDEAASEVDVSIDW
jgi:LDH2 family malate/lactate/ureidoglycolate dehydrogenase